MDQIQKDVITLVAVGDVSPNRDDAPSIFRHGGYLHRKADVVFGQMESPMSDRGTPNFVPHSPCKIPTSTVEALTRERGAGFDVMSFACNHAVDYGFEAFHDTLDTLHKNKIATVGAGRNIVEARKPAIVEKEGVKIGFLAYLSIVFPGIIAEEDVPGCVPLRASHHYQQVDFQPGTPPLIVTTLYPEDKAAMEEDIRKLRPQVDVVVVSMHAGVHVVPSVIAMYQKEAAYHAIDTGADLVLQHHSHILKGIEMYKDRAIFYCLNNFALEYDRLRPNERKAWDLDYRKLFHDFYRVKIHPGYERHRFHFDALKSLVAKAYIKNKKIEKVTYLPVYINPNLEPEVLTRDDPRAREVFDYVAKISEEQELNVRFSWDGDEVLINGRA